MSVTVFYRPLIRTVLASATSFRLRTARLRFGHGSVAALKVSKPEIRCFFVELLGSGLVLEIRGLLRNSLHG